MCNHLIGCAVSTQERKQAIELMRTAPFPYSMLAARALTGPCVEKTVP